MPIYTRTKMNNSSFIIMKYINNNSRSVTRKRTHEIDETHIHIQIRTHARTRKHAHAHDQPRSFRTRTVTTFVDNNNIIIYTHVCLPPREFRTLFTARIFGQKIKLQNKNEYYYIILIYYYTRHNNYQSLIIITILLSVLSHIVTHDWVYIIWRNKHARYYIIMF